MYFIYFTYSRYYVIILQNLIKFYQWLPKDNIIKSFIDKNCLYIFNEGPNFLKKSSTEVDSLCFKIENILNSNKTFDCSELKSSNKLSIYIYYYI